MSAEQVCPAHALAHVAPEFFETLTPAERAILPYALRIWARPEQRFPTGDWRSLGYICGRGWGKTETIAGNMNAYIASGLIKQPALAGPTEDRVDEVQIKALINTAPPWCKPERYRKSLRYPNGVILETQYATAPENTRGSNYDFAWLSEMVAWQESTRVDFFERITTVVRIGRAQYVYDTTSKGINEVILAQLTMHERNPAMHILLSGTTFENPILSIKYLASEVAKLSGQALDEELGGKIKLSADGALWDKALLDRTRVHARPARPKLTLVALDPAKSTSADADETGIMIGDSDDAGHTYVHTDQTGRHAVDGGWPNIAVDWCSREAAGILIERSGIGNTASFAIVAVARSRGMNVVFLDRDAAKEPFPRRKVGTIYIREVDAVSDKGARARGPAAEYAEGRAHIVGDLPKLEYQMCNYVPGRTSKSPNNYDAHAHLVTELAGLAREMPGARRADANAAASAQTELNRRLLAAAAGRRIG